MKEEFDSNRYIQKDKEKGLKRDIWNERYLRYVYIGKSIDKKYFF